MARRNKGVVFLSLGFLLLLIASGWYIFNTVEDENAGKQAAEILSKFETLPSTVPSNPDEMETVEPVIKVDGDAFCGKVVIEKVDIELPIYDEWNYERLKSAPCRYMGHIATNDMIIAGHNYRSHFRNLKYVKVGDKVTFIDVYGIAHNYEVCETVILDGTAVSDMHAGGWDFTLFTCTKGGEQRVTVRCKRKTE